MESCRPIQAEFRTETTRMLKTLKHQLDMISSDISTIKRDIFLLKTIKEVKEDTKKEQKEKKEEKEPKQSEGWWWGY